MTESLCMDSERNPNKLRQTETKPDETDVQERCLSDCQLTKSYTYTADQVLSSNAFAYCHRKHQFSSQVRKYRINLL